jgi:hypothetical protein
MLSEVFWQEAPADGAVRAIKNRLISRQTMRQKITGEFVVKAA